MDISTSKVTSIKINGSEINKIVDNNNKILWSKLPEIPHIYSFWWKITFDPTPNSYSYTFKSKDTVGDKLSVNGDCYGSAIIPSVTEGVNVYNIKVYVKNLLISILRVKSIQLKLVNHI